MSHRMRCWTTATAAVLMLTGIPAAIVTVATPPVSKADVCGSVGGRHVSVGGCRDIFNPVEDYAPPPAYYAPMPDDDPLPDDYPYMPAPAYVPPPPLAPNISVCGDIGRRINVSGCV